LTPTGEFSHKVSVNPWPENGINVELTATNDEREALCARFDLIELPSLSASVGIEQTSTGLELAGKIEAITVQSCVVTLKPVTSSLAAPFKRRYHRREYHEKLLAAGEAAGFDEETIDSDLLETDEIDIGEAVAEELFLALDPYPRSADADRAMEDLRAKTASEPDEHAGSPFDKLRRH